MKEDPVGIHQLEKTLLPWKEEHLNSHEAI